MSTGTRVAFKWLHIPLTEEGGDSLHAAKNNFSDSSVSKILLALL